MRHVIWFRSHIMTILFKLTHQPPLTSASDAQSLPQSRKEGHILFLPSLCRAQQTPHWSWKDDIAKKTSVVCLEWIIFISQPKANPLPRADKKLSHRNFCSPEKSASVTGIGFLEDQLLVTKVEELVKLLGVFQPHYQVLRCECLLSIAAVRVLQVDFIQQFWLGICKEKKW